MLFIIFNELISDNWNKKIKDSFYLKNIIYRFLTRINNKKKNFWLTHDFDLKIFAHKNKF